jgi:anti-sigma B factor antagonist
VPQLQLDISEDGPTRIVIAVTGEVDLASSPQLTECLLTHTDRDAVLDLSGVDFLDSTGINALIQGYNALRDAGHTLRTTGEQAHVLKVLDLTGLTELLHGGNGESAPTRGDPR